MEVNRVGSMGWTRRSAAVSVLLAMEEHRKAAGLRLIKLREAKRWTQEELAHAAKISVKTVSRFENGRHDGRRSTIRQIAQALEVDESDLIGPPPPPLGLGSKTQLDSIEEKLDAVLSRLDELEDDARETAAQAAEAAVARAEERTAESARATRGRRRAGGAA